eukprot:maker-scaffold_22-augustus-gene-3.59-mRNA-1 protein AED:0.56 eAED:0.56 QI:0/0/0/0.5/1/0.5/2/0/639
MVGCNDWRLLKQAEIVQYKLEVYPTALKYILERRNWEDSIAHFGSKKARHGVYVDFQNYTEEEFKRIEYPHGEGSLPVFVKNSPEEPEVDSKSIAPVDLEAVRKALSSQSSYNPFKSIFFKFCFAWEEKIVEENGVELYKRYDDGSILRTADRIYLTHLALEYSRHPEEAVSGAGLNLDQLQYDKIITAHFPTHLGQRAYKAHDLTAGEIYQFREAVIRPEFKAELIIPDVVTGVPVPFKSENNYNIKIATSASLIFTTGVVSFAAIAGVFVFEAFLKATDDFPPNVAEIISSIVNALAIRYLQYPFNYLARSLTDWENHKTDVDYNNHLVRKMFVFSFLNNYTTLIYVAFFRKWTTFSFSNEFCISDLDVLDEDNSASHINVSVKNLLSIDTCYPTLGNLLIARFLTQNILPQAKQLKKLFFSNADRKKAAGASTTEAPGKQFLLSQYKLFDEYLDLAIQFGYMVLFIAAFPLAPALAMLSRSIEVWINATAILIKSRRPLLERAAGLGSWLEIFYVLLYIGIVLNAAILAFSSNEVLPINKIEVRVCAFLGIICLKYIVKYIVQCLVPEVPRWVEIQKRREEYYEQKIFYEDDSEEKMKAPEQERGIHHVDAEHINEIKLAADSPEKDPKLHNLAMC